MLEPQVGELLPDGAIRVGVGTRQANYRNNIREADHSGSCIRCNTRGFFRNQLLILAQRPDARVVMGYRAWHALGHQVRRGEASISILAPCTYKTKGDRQRNDETDDHRDDDNDDRGRAGERRVLRGFRVAHVFDIAQTDGDHVQPPARPELLHGDAPAGLWDSLARQVAAAGFTLTRGRIPNGANGTTNFAARTVTVADHLAAAQAAKTLAHELAHVTMHNGTEYTTGCRGRAEIEAESVAYIICQAAGLTTAAYSFGYVAHWSGGDPAAVKDTAERVVTTGRPSIFSDSGTRSSGTEPAPFARLPAEYDKMSGRLSTKCLVE